MIQPAEIVFVIGLYSPFAHREIDNERGLILVAGNIFFTAYTTCPRCEETVFLRQLVGNRFRHEFRLGYHRHKQFGRSGKRHIFCQEHGRQHFFAATPFALCIQTQGSAIHPFPVGKDEGIGNRFSRLVVCRGRLPLFFHSFFSPLNNLCRAAAVLQWRKHSLLPVFPVQ